MKGDWFTKDIPEFSFLDKKWEVPSWFLRACVLLVFTIPTAIYTGIKSLAGNSSYGPFFLLTFGITGFALVPVLGFFLEKSFSRRFGEKSFRFVLAIIILSVFVLLGSTVFRGILEDGFSALRGLY